MRKEKDVKVAGKKAERRARYNKQKGASSTSHRANDAKKSSLEAHMQQCDSEAGLALMEAARNDPRQFRLTSSCDQLHRPVATDGTNFALEGGSAV